MAKFENVSGQTMDSKLVATPTSDGLMSAADKAKLDTISEGAGGYVHPATHPATMITQDTTHRFVTDTEKSTWNAKASTTVASTSANGLMSKNDKTKLDGIATGANKTVVDSSLSSSSANPVQNKVINTALAGKAPISHTHTKSQITDFPSSLPANGGNADTVDGKHATDFATSGHTHTTLMATDLTGQTKSLDSFTLNTGTPKIAYYVCLTDGGGENITGRPDDANKRAFILEVQSIRYTSSSDYITKQIYTIGSLKLSYVRYCTNGTWSAWERMYTSVQKPTPSEIGAAASSHTHTASQVTQDSTHRFVTDTEKSTWNGKASTAVVTTSANGLMSKADKTKLDGIATGANKYVHPTGAGNNHIPSGGSAGQFLKWSASGTAVWAADNNTTYSPATTSANGLMSSTDKAKLDGIATGANKIVVDSSLSSSSTNPVQNKVVKAALDGKAASSHGKHVPTVCDTITDWNSVTTNGWYMASGGKNAPTSADWYMGYVITHNTNYVIQELYKFTESTDAYVVSKYLRVRMNGTWGSWREVTVGAQVPTNAKFTDTVYSHPSTHPASMITADSSHRFVTDTEKSTWNAKASTSVATQSANGLMSSADKTKLDGIATGANKTVVDSSLSSSSTNPVQNKVINTALAGKAASSHNHTSSNITDLATFVDNRIKSKLLAAFPVGTVISSTNSANPSTYIGGTWQAFAPGRVLIGAGSGNDGSTSMSFTAGSSGGEYKHQHEYGLLHGEYFGLISRNLWLLNSDKKGNGEWVSTHSASYQATNTFNKPSLLETSTVSANQYACYVKTGPADSQMPYTVIYYWKRTA